MGFFERLRRPPAPPTPEEIRRHEKVNADLMAAMEDHNKAVSSLRAAEADIQTTKTAEVPPVVREAEVGRARAFARLEHLPLMRAQEELKVNMELLRMLPPTPAHEAELAEMEGKIAELGEAIKAAEDEAERKVRGQ